MSWEGERETGLEREKEEREEGTKDGRDESKSEVVSSKLT